MPCIVNMALTAAQKCRVHARKAAGFRYAYRSYMIISQYRMIVNPVHFHYTSNDGEIIPEDGKKALELFLENYPNDTNVILNWVFAYYQKIRKELGYDVSANEDYPDVNDAAAISQIFSLRKIVIPMQSR